MSQIYTTPWLDRRISSEMLFVFHERDPLEKPEVKAESYNFMVEDFSPYRTLLR